MHLIICVYVTAATCAVLTPSWASERQRACQQALNPSLPAYQPEQLHTSTCLPACTLLVWLETNFSFNMNNLPIFTWVNGLRDPMVRRLTEHALEGGPGARLIVWQSSTNTTQKQAVSVDDNSKWNQLECQNCTRQITKTAPSKLSLGSNCQS